MFGLVWFQPVKAQTVTPTPTECSYTWGFDSGNEGWSGAGWTASNGYLTGTTNAYADLDIPQELPAYFAGVPSEGMNSNGVTLTYVATSTHLIQWTYSNNTASTSTTPTANRTITRIGINKGASVDSPIDSITINFPCAYTVAPPPSTPTPVPTPQREIGWSNLPGVPYPFEIPEPDPDATLDLSPFWDYPTWFDFFRVVVTVFELAKRYYIIVTIVTVGMITAVYRWIAGVVARRPHRV